MSVINARIQSTAVDILQALIARGDVEMFALQTAETIVIGKLFACVHLARLDLQNKLLHLLHSIISAFRTRTDAGGPRARPDSNKQTEGSVALSYSVNPLLILTLIDGISTDTNRPVLQHWLDFILMTIPQFHDMLQPAIIPLNNCVCKQLNVALSEVRLASSGDGSIADITTFTTDADFMMLLNAVERLVLLSLSQLADAAQVDDDGLPDKPGHEGSSILGYVSNVFSADGTSGPSEESSQVSHFCLVQIVCHADGCRSRRLTIDVYKKLLGFSMPFGNSSSHQPATNGDRGQNR